MIRADEPDLGAVRLCVQCGEWWPDDEEFWPDEGATCRACRQERRDRRAAASARYRAHMRRRLGGLAPGS